MKALSLTLNLTLSRNVIYEADSNQMLSKVITLMQVTDLHKNQIKKARLIRI